ncbi:uncharacterized protein LOC113765703 isoform X2 [Coffea eugenioides]|uniref:uncharacterized protein LOC113754814 isoform X2 n=1 Tax=Coffea eugenioides TaxID=49369 RepID=UPI000F60582A|nr:uncharacterized protein LOC113754814 isoform X2 [Coffea eugenioides]XP_027165747.1 uncharacterized protein LOC113765703 isoform X2 [Coffea eugenioides]
MEAPIWLNNNELEKGKSLTLFYNYYRIEEKISTFEYGKHGEEHGEVQHVCRSLTLDEMIERALLHDDKDEFVPLINENYESTKDVPGWILEQMFAFDSSKCFAAVINGETGTKFCLRNHESFSGCSRPPLLHLAAYFSSVGITKWLLANGDAEGANYMCESDFYHMKDMLPIDVALLSVRSGIQLNGWTRQESIFSLFFGLLRGEKRRSMEVLRLLAQHTNEIREQFFKYTKPGKLVDVAALLLVAHQKLMPLNVTKEMHGLPLAGEQSDITKFVACKISRIDILQKRSLYSDVDNELLQEWKDMKARMKMILLLFKIFENIGHSLSAFLQLDPDQEEARLAAKLAWIFEQTGLHVKDRDIHGVCSTGACANLTLVNKIVYARSRGCGSCMNFGHEEKRSLEGFIVGVPKIQQQASCSIPIGHSSYHTLTSVGAKKESGSAGQLKIMYSVAPKGGFTKYSTFLVKTLKRGMRHM